MGSNIGQIWKFLACQINIYFALPEKKTMHSDEKNNDQYHRLEQEKQMKMVDKEDGNQSPAIDQEV